MKSEDIIKILNTRWGYGFLFLLLFIVVMFAVSSGMYCDLQIEKAVDYVRNNECNTRIDLPFNTSISKGGESNIPR